MADLAAHPAAGRVAERRLALLAALAGRDGGDVRGRAAIAVGAGDDLAELIARVVAAASPPPEWLPALLRDFGGRVVRSHRAGLQAAFCEVVAAVATPALRAAALRGAVEALPKGEARAGSLRWPAPSRALLTMVGDADAGVAAAARELVAAVTIVGAAAATTVAALTADEQRLVEAGQVVFARACASCHQLDGGGMQGLAPPLRDSEWVLGPVDRLVRIIAHGVRGPIEVAGTTWSLEMPGQRQLSDADLAAVASYVRRAFGHAATVVAPATVAAVRAAHERRSEPWTAAELIVR